MTTKLDKLRQVGSANVAESVQVRPKLPAGFKQSSTVEKPTYLAGVSRDKDAVKIPTARIERDEAQPREDFDQESLTRLAESLRTRGQLQPIRVRWDDAKGIYTILCGERRWRAARLIGMTELACVIHQGTITETERLEIQLVENALREDLKPVEQAKAYRSLMESRGWTTRDLANELSIDQSAVVHAMALLRLPDDVQANVDAGDIAPSSAYEISKAPVQQQSSIAERVLKEKLPYREVSAMVKEAKAPDTICKIKTTAGPLVTVEWKKGLNPTIVEEALTEALHKMSA